MRLYNLPRTSSFHRLGYFVASRGRVNTINVLWAWPSLQSGRTNIYIQQYLSIVPCLHPFRTVATYIHARVDTGYFRRYI